MSCMFLVFFSCSNIEISCMFQGCFARMLDFIDEYYWAIMGLCLGVGVAMVRNDVTVYQHCHCLLLSPYHPCACSVSVRAPVSLPLNTERVRCCVQAVGMGIAWLVYQEMEDDDDILVQQRRK